MLKEFSEERKKDKESLKKDPQQRVDEELKQVAESVRCFSTHQLFKRSWAFLIDYWSTFVRRPSVSKLFTFLSSPKTTTLKLARSISQRGDKWHSEKIHWYLSCSPEHPSKFNLTWHIASLGKSDSNLFHCSNDAYFS